MHGTVRYTVLHTWTFDSYISVILFNSEVIDYKDIIHIFTWHMCCKCVSLDLLGMCDGLYAMCISHTINAKCMNAKWLVLQYYGLCARFMLLLLHVHYCMYANWHNWCMLPLPGGFKCNAQHWCHVWWLSLSYHLHTQCKYTKGRTRIYVIS